MTGCLWIDGLQAENAPRLAAAGEPAHLVRPVPDRWCVQLNTQYMQRLHNARCWWLSIDYGAACTRLEGANGAIANGGQETST
jgi:hypothetical protein